MSERLQAVRGTQDILPEMSRAFRYLDATAFQWAERFGYEEIDTPIFEFTEVFHRTLGETSDTISKETYTFTDRGGESLTLRPEGTAGIARAFISNGLAQNLPLKFYYSGPMFRYERPQKGRYRQFHQIGVEHLGSELPVADVECISLGYQFLKSIGLLDKINLEINSLGDPESRNRHRESLVQYLSKYRAELSPDSQIRLDKNPLRILDSKDPKDQILLENAPALNNSLNDESKKFFDQVLAGLTQLNIPFAQNDRLVRGFDYYTHSVFEFTTPHLGAQSAVLSGGRYNGLISLMGGPDTPGVGWAAGTERLALLIDSALTKSNLIRVAVAAAEDEANSECATLTQELRLLGFNVENISGGNLGKKMKRAAKIQAAATLILGSEELKNQQVTLKNMSSGEQSKVDRQNLVAVLKKLTAIYLDRSQTGPTRD